MKNKKKLLLLIGAPLIAVGMITKLSCSSNTLPLIFFIAGASCKITYLMVGLKKGTLSIGNELLFMLLGVSLVLVGAFNKNTPAFANTYPIFLISGIFFKLTFVYLFIRKNRKKQTVKVICPKAGSKRE